MSSTPLKSPIVQILVLEKSYKNKLLFKKRKKPCQCNTVCVCKQNWHNVWEPNDHGLLIKISEKPAPKSFIQEKLM